MKVWGFLFLLGLCAYFCSMNVLKWILYLAALGGFIWFVFFREFNPFSGTDDPPVVTDITSDSSAYTETDTTSYAYESDTASEETYVEEETIDPIVEEEVVVDNPPKETPSTGIQLGDKYLVVVGSFGSKANANKLEKSLRKKGMEVTQTKIRNLNRVVIASATDEASAEAIKSDYLQKTGASAFVLEQ